MDRSDLIVKMIVGVSGGIVSVFTGLFGLVFTALLGLMLIDFITGIIAAMFNEGLKSAKGYKGLFKKIYTILLIGAVLFVEIAVIKTKGVVTDGLSTVFCVIELVSIAENGGAMGIRLPHILTQFIAALKEKVGEDPIEPPEDAGPPKKRQL